MRLTRRALMEPPAMSLGERLRGVAVPGMRRMSGEASERYEGNDGRRDLMELVLDDLGQLKHENC
jgi:hypothetical protein